MIRLGSLAGYPFEGPRVLAGWTAPAIPAVYASSTVPDRPASSTPSSTSATATTSRSEPFPFRHPRAPCWVERAGSKWKVFIATYEVPGGLASHRELIVRELCAVYQPSCNEQQFDHAWEDHWIGSYPRPPPARSAPAAQPGRTSRGGRDQDGTGSEPEPMRVAVPSGA